MNYEMFCEAFEKVYFYETRDGEIYHKEVNSKLSQLSEAIQKMARRQTYASILSKAIERANEFDNFCKEIDDKRLFFSKYKLEIDKRISDLMERACEADLEINLLIPVYEAVMLRAAVKGKLAAYSLAWNALEKGV
jgi:predicted transcriptional regulator